MSVPASRTSSHASATGSISGGGGGAQRLRRPTEFRLLDGRRVLVALPEDVPGLRSKYGSSSAEASDPLAKTSHFPWHRHGEGANASAAASAAAAPAAGAADASATSIHPPSGMQVEVVVHGSAEHEALLREALSQHEARREHLRATHGDEVLDEWD